MNEIEYRKELERLNIVLELIRSRIATEMKTHNESRTELAEALIAYWEEQRTDFWYEAQLAESVGRERSIAAATHRRQLQFEKMVSSPYFGRIDFVENRPGNLTGSEAIYIGIAALADPGTGELWVYDWRSPIAGMFYDYGRGASRYNCPAGEITGTITLKRQYKITKGQMEYMFDSDIKIDDQVLQEILGKSSDERMHAIVTSIQREQNQAIRAEGHGLLVVQGPAGSGKTSIALHRGAYLLYRERNSLTSKNILILSPNRIFSDYISGVLPELGEENVLQTTFDDYVANIGRSVPAQIEDRNTQLENLFTDSKGTDQDTQAIAIRYKSSPQFAAIIEAYLGELDDNLISDYPDLNVQGQTVFTRAEWEQSFRQDLSYLPPAKRLAQIRHLIQVRLRPFVHQLRHERELIIANSGEEVNDKEIKALARIAARQEMEPFMIQLNQLTELHPLALYRRLFEDQALWNRLITKTKTALPEGWEKIRLQTLERLDNSLISYEDSLAFLYFQGMLEGFPVKTGIRHLIIDEAQDYTLMQYKILRAIFPGCYWTILGDPAQSIHPYLQTVDLPELSRIIRVENPLFIKLGRSYRSTREIQLFSQALLPAAEPVEMIHRSGRLPQVIRLERFETIALAIRTTLTELAGEGWNSLAIVCKTIQEATAIYQQLSKDEQVNLITQDTPEFKRGTVIIPSYLTKGLEFDAVLVADASATEYHSETERKLFYTICTRAQHRLILFYTGKLSPFIAAVDPGLYQTIDLKPLPSQT